jgi:hypothetical protein
MEYNCSFIQVDLIAACIELRVVGSVSVVSSGVGVEFHNPSANGKQGPIPEEIYQTLVTARNTLFAL